MKKFNIVKMAQDIEGPWIPFEVTQVNQSAIRLAKIKGEYRWHVHPKEDEFFYVLKGEITIESKEGAISLKEGEGALVPQGVMHRSKSTDEALVLLVEPIWTNTRGVVMEEEKGAV